jgi:hypothetical protein
VGNFANFSTFSSLVRDDRRRGKYQGYFRTGHEGSEGKYGCSSTLSLTSALDGGRWPMPRPGRLPPGKGPGTHCGGGCVGLRAGLFVSED